MAAAVPSSFGCLMRSAFLILAVAVLVVGHGPRLDAQRYQTLGPNECLNCHDHQAERQWYEKQEIPEVRKLFPQKGPNAGHINSLMQLEAKKSDDYAKAVGLKDKYAVNGSCVKCHATVFSGDANAGVSCESCHGPASGYLKPHQTKGAYKPSVAAGMIDLVGNIQAWAQQCTTCHVMDDPKLIAAGHPSGDDFDLGAKYGPVALHFKRKYSAAEVGAIGKQQFAAIVARRRGGAPPAAAAPAVASTPAAAPAPPAPAPAPVPAAPAAATTVTNPAGRQAVPSPTPAAPPQGRPAAVVPRPAPPAAAPVAAPAAPAPAPASPATAPAPAAPAVPAPATAPSSSVAMTQVPPTIQLPSSLSGAVALAQGKVIAALTDLLQKGTAVPTHTATAALVPAPYSGPDAALLELQREAIALALEALGTAPAAPAAPPQR